MKTLPIVSEATPVEATPESAIRARAYELYTKRGMAEGHDINDWLTAEAELNPLRS